MSATMPVSMVRTLVDMADRDLTLEEVETIVAVLYPREPFPLGSPEARLLDAIFGDDDGTS